ncbi:MAG: DUF4184 family protein [Gammaproteobacteria bacterium]
MPWTFSHPAAILPLRRLTPNYLSLPALVCGSMAPDMGYYVGRYDIAGYAHTGAGSVLAGLPLGLACLLLFYVLRRPLWFLLPQPHRSALAPLLESRPWRRKSFWIVAAVSALIGVWTHDFWDSFTHYNGWMVLRIPLLQDLAIRVGGVVLPAHRFLQYLSTVVGAAALALAYVSWLRRQPRSPLEGRADGLRYLAMVVACAVSLAVAFPLAERTSREFSGDFAFQVLIIQLAIRAGTALGLIVLVYSAVYAAVARSR